jgi:MFS family permease
MMPSPEGLPSRRCWPCGLVTVFCVSLASLGLLFFGMNLLAALSFVAAPRLVRRFGPLKTMIAPHFVSNLFLLSVAFMPTFPLAAAFLLLRQSLSKLDVPARQAYTMALVSPEERTAAASYTTVARNIAVSASPPVAAFMHSGPMLVLGLPILLASCIGYDATMWRAFRHVPLHPSHEEREDFLGGGEPGQARPWLPFAKQRSVI